MIGLVPKALPFLPFFSPFKELFSKRVERPLGESGWTGSLSNETTITKSLFYGEHFFSPQVALF